jgi:sterol desaturase/sphingolipid hydroxylase (fatty acid hydroxylase superfamily)
MKKNEQSIRIFKSSLLEWFTHIHPVTPAITWLPVVATCFWRGVQSDLTSVQFSQLFLTGIFFWTLVEYVLHRFLFHFEAKNAFFKRVHFLFHGVHHDDPQDPTRLVMPPLVSFFLASFFAYGLYQLLGTPGFYPFFSAFILGYLCYDYIHYAIHHFQVKLGFLAFLKKNHMYHHFVDSTQCIGVSSPLWDFVFQTFRYKKKHRSSDVASFS